MPGTTTDRGYYKPASAETGYDAKVNTDFDLITGHVDSHSPYVAWQATTAVATGQYTDPVTPNAHIYQALNGGTTGATEPTFPTSAGATVVDGTVTWMEVGLAYAVHLQSVRAGQAYVDPRTTDRANGVVGGKDPGEAGYSRFVAGTPFAPLRTFQAAAYSLPLFNNQAAGEIHIAEGPQFDMTAAPGTWAATAVAFRVTSPIKMDGTDTHLVPATITTASWLAGIATFTTSAAHGFVPGQMVVTQGQTNASYNEGTATPTFSGSPILACPSTTTFTIAMAANPGAWVGGGTPRCSVFYPIGRGLRIINHGGMASGQTGSALVSSGGNYKGSGLIYADTGFPNSTAIVYTGGTNVEWWWVNFGQINSVTGCIGVQVGKDSSGAAVSFTSGAMVGCSWWGFTNTCLDMVGNNTDAMRIFDCYFGFTTSYGVRMHPLSGASPNNVHIDDCTFWGIGPMLGGSPAGTACISWEQTSAGAVTPEVLTVTNNVFFGGTYALSTQGGCAGLFAGNQVELATIGGGPNARQVNDCVTNATTTITSATANFQPSDVGQVVAILGATFAAATKTNTTIASRTNSTTVVLTDTVDQTINGLARLVIQPVLDRPYVRLRNSTGSTLASFGKSWVLTGNFFHQGTTTGWTSGIGVHIDIQNVTDCWSHHNDHLLDTSVLTSSNPLVVMGSGSRVNDIDVGRVDDEPNTRTISVCDYARLFSDLGIRNIKRFMNVNVTPVTKTSVGFGCATGADYQVNATNATANGVAVGSNPYVWAVQAGGLVTITTTAAHGFSVGQSVTLAGWTPAAINGTYTVVSVPSSTTFTYFFAYNQGDANGHATVTGTAVQSSTLVIDESLGTFYVITLKTNTAFTIANPINNSAGRHWTLLLKNGTGGAWTGNPLTFGGKYHPNAAAAFPAGNIANNKARRVDYDYDSGSDVMWEASRVDADS